MIRERGWILRLATVGLLAASVALGAQESAGTPPELPVVGDVEMLRVGAKAPRFVLEDLDGKTLDLGREVAAKVHLLVFWSMFCEACATEMPLIQRISEEYRDRGLEVLAIAMDGEPMTESIRGLVKQRGYTFRVFVDPIGPDGSFLVADPYGVIGTPTLYLIGRDGRVSFVNLGRTPRETLEEAIRGTLGAH